MISTERLSQEQHLVLNDCGVYRAKEHFCASRQDHCLLYTAEGNCRFAFSNQPIEEGNVVLFSPKEAQEYFLDKDSVVYYAHFCGRDCESILQDLSLCGKKVFFMGKSKEFEETFAAMRMEHYLKRGDARYSTAALLLKLLVVISRKYRLIKGALAADKANVIYRSIERMNMEIGAPISVEELAKQSGYSVSRFSHLFKEVIGTAPHLYLADLRMEKAKDLLINTHYTVAEIGRAVGFADQNYFSRFFKKKIGVSPSEYRENL